MQKNWLSKVVTVCALTIAFAAMKWLPPNPESYGSDGGQTGVMIQAFLQANDFTLVSQTNGQYFAQKQLCDVVIKLVAPEGWNESQMKLISSGRRLFYAVDGLLYSDEQPVWRTWFEDKLQRTLFRLGIAAKKVYVFGIAPSLSCDKLAVDWAVVSETSSKVR